MNRLGRNLAAVFVLASAGAAAPAMADTFTYTYSSLDGNGLSGTLVLYGNLISPGVFAIVGGTDTAVGGTDSALDGVFSIEGGYTLSFNTGTYLTSPSGLYDYDNLLSPAASPTFLDIDGLLFGGPGSEINLWGNADGTYTYNSEINGAYETPNGVGTEIAFSFVSDIPEPLSAALLGTGLAAISLLGLTRRRSTENVI